MTRPPGPPTLDHFRSTGLRQIAVTCATYGCRRQSHLTFDALGLPGDTPFPEVVIRRYVICSGRGGHGVEVSINWRYHRPKGVGWT